MAVAFDSPVKLTVKYFLGVIGTITCALLITRILFNIELNQFKKSIERGEEEEVDTKNLSELTLSSSSSSSEDAESLNVAKPSPPKDVTTSDDSSSFIRKTTIHKETKYMIFVNVFILTLANYLLLVYLPSGVVPSLIAMPLLSCFLIRKQLIQDLWRKRLDRISQCFTLLIFMASSMSLSTYASLGKEEGGMYEGPARIVGYDYEYINDNYVGQAAGAMTTNLEVEWGGSWGCPDTPDKQCRAYVSGALCKLGASRKLAKEEGNEGDFAFMKEYYEENIRGKEDKFVEKVVETATEVEDEIQIDTATAVGVVEEDTVDTEEAVVKDVTPVAPREDDEGDFAFMADYYKENIRGKEEEFVEKEKKVAAEILEEEVLDKYYEQDETIDSFEDEYWGYDWGSPWGDYTCDELFDTDLEGTTFNEDEAPGQDDWPYFNIYGSCNSCNILEHFDNIQQYQRHALTYALFGFLSMVVTVGLMLKQWLRPAEENQIDLLMSELELELEMV